MLEEGFALRNMADGVKAEQVISVDEVRCAAEHQGPLCSCSPEPCSSHVGPPPSAHARACAQWHNNNLCLQRKRGRATIGHEARGEGHVVRGPASHVLACMTAEGFIDAAITQNAFDADEFLGGFRGHVLPYVQPYPGPCSLVVIDNWSGHHKDPSWIVEVYQRGGRVRFLPPYCPWFQPIETGIHHVKQWIKKHRRDVSTYTDHAAFLRAAMYSVGKSHAAEAFHTCVYAGEEIYPQ